MPRRIILHAGFHKTGTSSVQATLRENRVALKKQIALRLRWHMKDIVAAARGYSMDRDPLTLIKLQSRFGAMINALPGMPKRTLVISAEELCGHLPGRANLPNYNAAPVLLYAYWEIMRARYPQAEIVIFFTTRDTEKWLGSAYWEHVRSSDMTLDFTAFSNRFRPAGDLDAVVKDVASRVPTQVVSHRLEECRDLLLGPADPLLDLCDIPASIRPTLMPVPTANRKLGPRVLNQLLEINRTMTDPVARNAAKKALQQTAKPS